MKSRRLLPAKPFQSYYQRFTTSKLFHKLIPTSFNHRNQLKHLVPEMRYRLDLNSYTNGIIRPGLHKAAQMLPTWRVPFWMTLTEALGEEVDPVIPLMAIGELANVSLAIVDDMRECYDNPTAVHNHYEIDITLNAASSMFFIGISSLDHWDFSPELKAEIHKSYASSMAAFHLAHSHLIQLESCSSPAKLPLEDGFLESINLTYSASLRVVLHWITSHYGYGQDVKLALKNYASICGVVEVLARQLLALKGVYQDIESSRVKLGAVYSLIKLVEQGDVKEKDNILSLLGEKDEFQKLIQDGKVMDVCLHKLEKLLNNAYSGLRMHLDPEKRPLVEEMNKRLLEGRKL